jgi:ParB family chromosome partitioning protein
MTAKKSKAATATAPQIEQWPTTKPIPYARNARKIDARAVSAVAGSIKEFGFKSPILVDAEGVIIAGHTRLQAAQSLGLESVPVIVCRDLTTDQVKAYRLADNRVAEFSEWDAELLKLELGDIEMEMDFAGFDEMAIDMPDHAPEQTPQTGVELKAKYVIIVDCINEDQQADIFSLLTERGIKCKLSTM